MTDSKRGHSGSLQQQHISLGAGVGFSYRSWLQSLRGHSSRTAKLKQLQRAGRTSSHPPYPSKLCAYARIFPPSSRYSPDLSVSPTHRRSSPADSATLQPLLLLFKPQTCPRCTVLSFCSSVCHTARSWTGKEKRPSKLLPSKSNKEVMISEAFGGEVLHLRALPSLAGGAVSEERAVRSWRRRCAPLRHPLPLAANSFSACLMLDVCRGGEREGGLKRFAPP